MASRLIVRALDGVEEMSLEKAVLVDSVGFGV